MGRHTPYSTNEAAMRSTMARIALFTLAASLVLVCLSLVFGVLNPTADADVEGLTASTDGHSASEGARMHFIYTLGCNAYQLVQAVVLDHTWKEAGNVGRLTRIVVNCSDDAKSRALLDDSVLKHDPRFSIFFTEGDLMTVPVHGDKYPARGRPYAIMQWLEAVKPKEPLVAILDPDFAFLRPLSSHPDLPKVQPGRIIAQKYDLGLGFLEGFAAANEPKPRVTFDEAVNHWSTGPPWVLHTQDLRTMLPDWGRYTDKWSKDQGLLREQYSFCMAALKHNMSAMGQNGLMVSSPIAWNEAWSTKDSRPESWKPYVLHYCRSYGYGEWGFHKALIADNWYAGDFKNTVPGPFQCGAPLLQEPPPPPSSEPDREKFMHAWLLWRLFPAMNKAFAAYQEQHCPAGRAQKRGGLVMRTMQPTSCDGRTKTRYRVTPGSLASWTSTGAPGDDRCGEAAQQPLL